MMKNRALITGIAGQDGAYLAQFLLGKDYDVHGVIRWDAHNQTGNLGALDILERVTLHSGDLTDAMNIAQVIKAVRPSEIYNLGALTQVHTSFQTPSSTFDINVKGALNVMDALRMLEMADDVRLYQASSSEMFGNAPAPQNEKTPMNPVSPYGASKLAAYNLARIYRESYGMHISNGILFNHESSLRGEHFVTQKIAQSVAAIQAGKQEELVLGNLESERDWGHARDYVRGMWLMLQQDKPADYVLATGETRTVRTFTEACFDHVGMTLRWEGKGVDEVGIDAQSGKTLVRVSETFFRPNELHSLQGDASKAKTALGWAPEISFTQLVEDMMTEARKTDV